MPTSGQSHHPQLRRSLEQSRIFGDSGTDLIVNLMERVTIKVVCGGQALFNEGDPSDYLLVVVTGRLLASRLLADGSRQRFNEIGPGSSVGEIGLILQQPRSADVMAIRDSTVAMLGREQFEFLLTRHPIELNRAITRTLFSYANQQFTRPPVVGATSYAVVPLDADVDIGPLCTTLQQALSKHGATSHIGVEDGRRIHDDSRQHAHDQLSDLEQHYEYIIYQASTEDCDWSQLAVRQADQVLLVASHGSDPDAPHPAKVFLNGPGFEMVRKSLLLLHDDDVTTARIDSHWHQQFDLERIYPVRPNAAEDIARLGRFITGKAIGLVLGGGGARGLAHIGVLKALNEAKIPIDIICGNSMGALIGAQYANGTPTSQLLESTTAFVRGGERLTFPWISLLAGKRVRRDIQKMFQGASIEALWRPFFAVSCNLSQANIRVHDKGPLWQAVLASNSPAGILPPVVENGELFVDAALLDNVPVKAMRERLGFGTLIAVDVDVRQDLSVDPSLTSLSPWKALKDKLFGGGEPQPGIFELLNRSGHLGGLANRDAYRAQANHYLQPPVAEFPLMGYSKGEDIVKAGYRYAKSQIARWNVSQVCLETTIDESTD